MRSTSPAVTWQYSLDDWLPGLQLGCLALHRLYTQAVLPDSDKRNTLAQFQPEGQPNSIKRAVLQLGDVADVGQLVVENGVDIGEMDASKYKHSNARTLDSP